VVVLNNGGWIVGYWFDQHNGTNPYQDQVFIQWLLQGRSGSTITLISAAVTENTVFTDALYGINDRGVSVGEVSPPPLPNFTRSSFIAYGLNDNDQVVGESLLREYGLANGAGGISVLERPNLRPRHARSAELRLANHLRDRNH